MLAKEYLSQAKHLDTRINSKIRQIDALNDLATNASSALNGMPRNPNHGRSSLVDCVTKIVDLQTEINSDIDDLVDLKREIMQLLKAIPNPEYQTILERRYLVFETWERIAADMGYDLRWLFRLHGKALEEVQGMLDKKEAVVETRQ